MRTQFATTRWDRLGMAVAAGLAMIAATVCNAQDDVPVPAAAAAEPSASVDNEANVEVLTSGPVHEAFANPATSRTDEGLVIREAPPEPIDELPPAVMPQGQNVEWIPGYWAWNDEQDDFLWVSGLWRNIPPEQRWVPGYWAQIDSGHRWVSGFWTSADRQNLDYLPYPPASQEYGPNSPAPGPEYFWMPGSWVYTSGDYQWQPGYWAQAYDDWCWTPQRYVWTPRGALYSPGYWDYRVPYRGTLFAPVRFTAGTYYGRPFTPGYVINPAGLLVSLFVNPQYGHYYFGNYYGDQYFQRGYRPWYDAAYRGQYQYDPLLAFYESYYDRRGVDFSGRINEWFNYYEQNPDRRPARTWSETVQLANRSAADGTSTVALARPLHELVDSDTNLQQPFRRLSDDQRTSFSRISSDIRELRRSRGRIEADAAITGRTRSDRADDSDAQSQPPGNARSERAAPDADGPVERRTGYRGLQLPQVERRAAEILGDDRRPQRQQPQSNAPDARDRQRPAADQGSLPDSGTRQEQLRERLSRPQPPQRPSSAAPDAARRDRNSVVPNAQRTQPPGTQGGPPAEIRQPSRNILQPRRGNFPQSHPGEAAPRQRPQLDPRDAIPQFRGRDAERPAQTPGPPQTRGRSAGDAAGRSPENDGGNNERKPEPQNRN